VAEPVRVQDPSRAGAGDVRHHRPVVLEYLLRLAALARVTLRRHRALVTETLLLRQQLAVLTRPTRRRPRLRTRDRLVWVLASALRRDWRCHLLLVRPQTVIGWHRRGWRLFWRWTSRVRLGRPRLSLDVRALIATMCPVQGPQHPQRIGVIVARPAAPPVGRAPGPPTGRAGPA
jgi:hypothetical protein